MEESNLNRQYYFKDQIGSYKSEALREVLEAIDDQLELEIHNVRLDGENLKEIFKDADILVECLDSPETKSEIVNGFLSEFDRPVVAASGISGYYSSDLITTRRIMKNLYLVGDGICQEETKDLFLSPRVNIAAQHQANMVVRLIMGEEEV